MKNLILFTIFLIILTSLCAYLPGIELPEWISTDQIKQTGVTKVETDSPDVFLSIEITPSEIKVGRDAQILFEIKNKQIYDLKNVVLESYNHPCFSQGTFSENIGTLKGNGTKMLTWKWTSDSDILMDKDCRIKFRLSYDADYSYFQDIAVLPESEYYQRELEGTLKYIPIQSSSTISSLGISIEFSEDQPFLEKNTEYYMYINYYNTGKGFFEDIDIKLTAPNNIQNLDCYGYSETENIFYLDEQLIFIRGKATPTACSFDTKETSTVNIKSLSLTAKYKYVLDNSISVRVKR